MKMIDIHHDGIHFQILMMLIETLCIAVEIFPVIQFGERIALCIPDDAPVFGKFNTAQDAGKDHLGLRIRFGNKIRRPHPEDLHLSIQIRCQNDHRDMMHLRICLDSLKHLPAGHPGHHQIQQDHRERIPVFPDHLHGALSIPGTQDLIVAFQDSLHHDPVDLLIINDQDLAFPVR